VAALKKQRFTLRSTLGLLAAASLGFVVGTAIP